MHCLTSRRACHIDPGAGTQTTTRGDTQEGRRNTFAQQGELAPNHISFDPEVEESERCKHESDKHKYHQHAQDKSGARVFCI